MGEYEPEDSRKVTLEKGEVPGEPPRTGPREAEARDAAAQRKHADEAAKKDEGGRKTMPQQQQRGSQSQGSSGQQQQSGQSQSQSQQDSSGTAPAQSGGQSDKPSDAGLWGNDAPRMTRSAGRAEPGDPDSQDMQAQPGGPLAGNQPQAIDHPVGASDLHSDQYEVNQPQNMHQQDPDRERQVREQAARQENYDRGLGYGADGETEMRDAPDVSNTDSDESEEEKRGYGGLGEAEKKAYDNR